MDLVSPPKARPGDKVAVLSPSFAAPAIGPAVHEQALERLASVTGLAPVEFPTTRKLQASPRERAEDLNAAFGDRSIRALIATLGGDDQLTVIPYLNSEAMINDPKPFLGYSDNTNLLNWMWTQGIAGFHGGSTQLHLGPGPRVDPIHLRSLRAALVTGGRLEITEPGESEDFGRDWADPAALIEFGDREPTEPWNWSGSERVVSGPSWGGSVEVLQWILTAGRFPSDPSILRGAVLLLETTEELISALEFGRILRSLGERGILAEAAAVVVARPPASNLAVQPTEVERRTYRQAQREVVLEHLAFYNPGAVVVVGPPFGHTRPQWILPYGGTVTVDGVGRRLFADFS